MSHTDKGTPRNEAWIALIDDMLAELRSGDPRSEVFWAQQMAFAPVFPYAVLLRLRIPGWPSGPDDGMLIDHVLKIALSGLGALPEAFPGMDPMAIPILARRQADALATGRRSLLRRMGRRLGFPQPSESISVVPSRMLRPYPLLGWVPVRVH